MRQEKAQTSLELVFVVGFFLVIAIIIFPFITKQNELNKAVAAARDGAVFAASMRGMGYKGKDVTEAPEGIVKIERLKLVDKSGELTAEEKRMVQTWYQIRFQVSMQDYMKENSTCTQTTIGSTIKNQALRYINYTFSGTWPSGIVSVVYTDRFKFTAACDFV
jgi:hypothetical protein